MMMKPVTLLLLPFLLLSGSNIAKADRVEANNEPCSPHGLAMACPVEELDESSLVLYCDGKLGVHLAHCFMQYLCTFHDQDSVNDNKLCIDGECPLARHVPPLKCDGEGAKFAALETTSNNQEGGGEEEEQANEEAPAEETPAQEETNNEEEAPAEDPIDEEEVTEEIIEEEQEEEATEPEAEITPENPEDTTTESNAAEDPIDEQEVTEEIIEGEAEEETEQTQEPVITQENQATTATEAPTEPEPEPSTTGARTISPGMVFSLVVISAVFLGGLYVFLGVDQLMGYLTGSQQTNLRGKHQPVNLAPGDGEISFGSPPPGSAFT